MYVTVSDIQQARENLVGVIQATPLQYSKTFSDMSGNEIYFKPENLQKTGSFKVRGAYHKISHLSAAEKSAGVVAFSAGNHGAGTAYAARLLGVKATISMPTEPVQSKKAAVIGYGARVVDGGSTSITMYQRALELSQSEGLTMVHPFDDLLTIAGQGTIGLEILDELPDVEAVIIPVGGGGLISGVAAALKESNPAIQVIGVNPEGARSMYESVVTGRLTEVDQLETMADGLKAKRVGERTFAHAQKYVDEMVLVSEEEIAKAAVLLAARGKLVAEPSGAAALAAMAFQRTRLRGKKTVVLVSGGNVDMKLFADLIARYM
ncbi:threonine ammonia-lyase [Brevibacillus massiliensis]|uniref:threonine ammonia-lyase n=1 Tax=Brevibacillus massiliensis TaxID=1118054 RepID=UPI0002D6C502|nr:threonine/serine dehydratase [Brevibacillus massiliensis]